MATTSLCPDHVDGGAAWLTLRLTAALLLTVAGLAGAAPGPVAFFTPYFWSHGAVVDPRLAGLLLDSRPAGPHRPLQRETQYVPSVQTTAGNGETVARIAPTSFLLRFQFADQPALLNADLTEQEREDLQARVVKRHRNWTKDRDYLAPPSVGKLADLDPAQIVTPPPGLEVGYVPIATRQAAGE